MMQALFDTLSEEVFAMPLPPKEPFPPALQEPGRPVRPLAQHVRHAVLQAKLAVPGSGATAVAPVPAAPPSPQRSAPPLHPAAGHLRIAGVKPLQAKLAHPVLQKSAVAVPGGAVVHEEKKGGGGGGGGGGGKRPPLPSQEEEFLGRSRAKGIIVTHQQLIAARFQQMGGGAGWVFNMNGVRLHAWGSELPEDRFFLQGFTDGQHGARDRTRFLPGDGEFEKIFRGFGFG